MKKAFSSVSVFSIFFLTACVTVNIYFPAAAAEEVADEIIHGIQDAPQKSPEPEASRSSLKSVAFQWIDGILNVAVSPAHAAGANLDIDTPEIRQLRASMKKRYPSLQVYYNQGFIGIRNDGLLTTRDAGSIPLKDRNKVNKLVAAENSDRNKLYKAIANANGHPEWSGQIKSTFAQRWISNARPGWWYQTSNGSWKQR